MIGLLGRQRTFLEFLLTSVKDTQLETLESLPLPCISLKKLEKWQLLDDRKVVGETLSTACYLPESFIASLFFAWKYESDFSSGILSNAKVGGDNCHRGSVVLGSMLGIQTN